MATELGEAKVPVKLDVTEAKRQIEELRKSIKENRTSKAETGGRIVRKVEREARDAGASEGREKPISDRLIQAAAKRAERAVLGTAGARALRGAGGALGRLAGPGGGVPGAGGLPGAAGGLARGLGAAALIYGAVRIGAEKDLLTIAALKEAFPELLKDSPVLQAMEGLTGEIARKMDTLESAVAASVKAAASTSELGIATARIAGQAPGFAALIDQYGRDFTVETQKGRLDRAFSRFKRVDVAEAVGRSLGDAVKGSLNQ